MALLASADESSVLGEQAGRPGGEVQCCAVNGRLEGDRNADLAATGQSFEHACLQALVGASIADLDDNGRRDVLAEYYGKDPLLLEAALGALDRSSDAGDPADPDDAPKPAGRVMA